MRLNETSSRIFAAYLNTIHEPTVEGSETGGGGSIARSVVSSRIGVGSGSDSRRQSVPDDCSVHWYTKRVCQTWHLINVNEVYLIDAFKLIFK